MVWGSGGILVETEDIPEEEVLSSVGTQGIRGEPRPAVDILSVKGRLPSSESQLSYFWAAMFLVVGRSYPVGSQVEGAGAQAGNQS